MPNLNTKDAHDIERAYHKTRDITQSFYSSSEYQDFVKRYENRRDTYFMRPRSGLPKHRSKLVMGTYFLSVKAIDAQFKQMHSEDPFIHVAVNDNSNFDADAEEKAQFAHYDLQYDLKTGVFKPKLFNMDWYLELCGVGVGREYIRSKQIETITRNRNVDMYGFDSGQAEETQIQRKEFTSTQVIHPCNFAHKPTVSDFKDSDWASVRFLMPICEIYRILGNPMYYQPGVKAAIKKIEEGEIGTIDNNNQEFYIETGGNDQFNDHVVVQEYHGPIRVGGKRNDMNTYYQLTLPCWNLTLRLDKSPFKRHPYWKTQTYPTPHSPWGMGCSDTVLPITWWESDMVNNLNDYVKIIAKFNLMVKSGNIVGGMPMLYSSLPYGIIDVEENAQFADVMAPLKLDYSGINVVSQVMNLIEKYKQQQGMSSNARGQGSDQLNDTATGITLIAQRENAIFNMLADSRNLGIVDGMQIKLGHRYSLFNEPVEVNLSALPQRFQNEIKKKQGENISCVTYWPYELDGHDWSMRVNVKTPDAEMQKHLNYIKLLGFMDNKLQQTGQALPAEYVIDGLGKTAQAMDIPGAEETIRKIKAMVAQRPVQIPGAQGAGGMQQPLQLPPAPAQPIQQPQQGSAISALA